MTREEFEVFITHLHGRNEPVRVFARPPYQVVPCECADVNCHGWRFVELEARA